jgi:hypothetical protein
LPPHAQAFSHSVLSSAFLPNSSLFGIIHLVTTVQTEQQGHIVAVVVSAAAAAAMPEVSAASASAAEQLGQQGQQLLERSQSMLADLMRGYLGQFQVGELR